MQYVLSKQFEKDFSKLPKGVKAKAIKALETFVADPMDPQLRNHKLAGSWHNHYSINITGDVRAVYAYIENDIVHFVAIGTHSELYG